MLRRIALIIVVLAVAGVVFVFTSLNKGMIEVNLDRILVPKRQDRAVGDQCRQDRGQENHHDDDDTNPKPHAKIIHDWHSNYSATDEEWIENRLEQGPQREW